MPKTNFRTSKYVGEHVFCSATCTVPLLSGEACKECRAHGVPRMLKGKPFKAVQWFECDGNLFERVLCTVNKPNCLTCQWWSNCPLNEQLPSATEVQPRTAGTIVMLSNGSRRSTLKSIMFIILSALLVLGCIFFSFSMRKVRLHYEKKNIIEKAVEYNGFGSWNEYDNTKRLHQFHGTNSSYREEGALYFYSNGIRCQLWDPLARTLEDG